VTAVKSKIKKKFSFSTYGVVGAIRPMLFLLAFSSTFALLARRRFRIDESKGVAWG